MMITIVSKSANRENYNPYFSKSANKDIPQYLRICYDEDNLPRGKLSMSLLIGARTEEYGILVSDSRTINEKQEVLHENFQKIFAYKHSIVGYTGRYSFQEGMIQDIIGNIVDNLSDVDKISQSLTKMSGQLQRQLDDNFWVNFHIIQALDNQLIYRIIEFSSSAFYVTEIFAGDIRYSGIEMNDTSKLQIFDNPLETRKRFSDIIKLESKKSNLINDNTQGMIIWKNGEIKDIFQDKNR